MGNKCRQAGITLIELMIALALGLFLLSGVLYVYLSSKSSHSTQGAVSKVQETLRFGYEFLSFDLRMAGFLGCANPREMFPQVVANAPVPAVGLGLSLKGFDNGTGWTNPTNPLVTRVAGTDVVLITRASSNTVHLSSNSDGTKFLVGSNMGLDQTKVYPLIVTDCRRSDIFKGTVTASGSVFQIARTASNTYLTTPPPCTTKLITECGSAGFYKTDAMVALLESWSYFIGINANGNPALFRVEMTSGTTGSTTPEELVEGVEDMQLEYGLDTVDDTVFIADSYSSSPANWAQVVSVKVKLRARSLEDNVLPSVKLNPENGTKYTYNGAEVNDRRFRETFTTVVGLRNLVQ